MLRLRLETDSLFKKYGLNDFHVERNTNRQLTINGDCGEPIYFINGLELASRLTTKEREFLMDFIKNLLENDLDRIKEIISLKNEIKQLNKDPHNKNVTSTYSYAGGGIRKNKYIYHTEFNVDLIIFPDDSIGIKAIDATIEEIISVVKKKDFYIKELKREIEYDEHVSSRKERLAELQTCKI